jgi:hypothetical protein
MITEKPIWFIGEYNCEIRNTSLLTLAMERFRRRHCRTVRGEMVGYRNQELSLGVH